MTGYSYVSTSSFIRTKPVTRPNLLVYVTMSTVVTVSGSLRLGSDMGVCSQSLRPLSGMFPFSTGSKSGLAFKSNLRNLSSRVRFYREG